MIHPNARILNVKNTYKGIEARSQVLNYLEEKNEATAKEITQKISLNTRQVYFHLSRLKKSGNVVRLPKRPARWKISSIGQKRLFSLDK